MTVASDVKQCLANLKGIEATLSALAVQTQDEESSRLFHEVMTMVSQIVIDVRDRVGELEREELQYKGF
ncbi:DUF1657 domain-containing protein [Bacillus sp. AGMB 02131]|uniref:DUF1657 domain-containing protein n=1 Tax=Peribacillus faecalis TaxID=2772559 RepID=A0A927HD16_9BACI|nr:DUF1657 domain-containing protein [Peribacillus faecalis]MBD3110106.1 DUF1657 domain-containing protein [Peribacillus faecalis]